MENKSEDLLSKMPVPDPQNDEQEFLPVDEDEDSMQPAKDDEQKKRKRKLYRPVMPNLLSELYNIIEGFPNQFRERVCFECNWSIPTFYRKMRMLDKISVRDKSKRIPSISNAERERISYVFDEVYAETREKCDRYRATTTKQAS